jgi:cytochrome P450
VAPTAVVTLSGHVSTLLSDRCPLQLADWANSYGPIYKLQLLNRACVVLTDPAAAHELIRWGNSDNYLGKTRELYCAFEVGTKPHKPNILTSPDDAYWKAVRQATAPCFSISNLKQVRRRGGSAVQMLLWVMQHSKQQCRFFKRHQQGIGAEGGGNDVPHRTVCT